MDKKKKYLGDGVYVEWDGYFIILTTENGIGATNRIILDFSVIESLENYIDSLSETKYS